MRNKVKLDLYNKSKLIESKKIDINEWYDGEIIEIDSDEYRRYNNIFLIKGTQYNQNGEIEKSWSTYYDEYGRLIKSEMYDCNFNLIDIEEVKYDKHGNII